MDAAGSSPVALARRLWGWFELLPFRRGVALLAGALVVPALVIGGILTLGTGPRKDTSPALPPRHSPVRAAAPPAPTWGEYVAPRPITTTEVPPRPRSAPVSASPRPTHPAAHQPSSPACPPELKKWPWMWAMCMHKHGGRTHP